MQNTKSLSFMTITRCKQHVILLAFLWILGLLCGVFYGYLTVDRSIEYIQHAVRQPSSVSGLIVGQLLPLLLFALCVLIEKNGYLLLILFADAVCCGFSIYGICVLFRSAAWLICFLLCFSDATTAPLLLWLSVRRLSGRIPNFKRDMVKCMIILSIICLLDLVSISPFLVSLMNHS